MVARWKYPCFRAARPGGFRQDTHRDVRPEDASGLATGRLRENLCSALVARRPLYRRNRYRQQQIGSLRSEEQNVAATGAQSDVWLPSLVTRQRLRIFRHFPEQRQRIFSPANQRLENRKGG